ncbi:DinB superfamily protein [Hydrobacter penzbergensis]|uniref:DinB superfamily protein n=1 Tax=Hydrobacter penzbergensis TaxID=1235997 RepID=A0A8X8LCT7_9BACT|nr:DinB family protein [Hydrobacter penzbergensis]SDW45931.1 DinB superfamily protein [Hydrobacter penzbergensis]
MNDLSGALSKNTTQLMKAITPFSYEAFNCRPPEGGWTAGEVTEHLLLLDIRLTDLLQGPTAPLDRPPIDHTRRFAGLSDQTRKFNAPAFILPTETAKDAGAMADRILNQRRLIVQMSLKQDMNRLYTLYPHPAIGLMTGTEWIHFLIMHAERHLKQLSALSYNVDQVQKNTYQ